MTLIKHKSGKEVAREVPALWTDGDPLDRWFEGMVPSFWRRMPRTMSDEPVVYSPPVDIYQDGDQVVVKAELPGVKADDIELTIHGDTMTLKGSKKFEEKGRDGGYQYTERRYGEFLRTFSLPTPVDESKVKADFKEGVLEIHMPIAEEAKPHRISIAETK